MHPIVTFGYDLAMDAIEIGDLVNFKIDFPQHRIREGLAKVVAVRPSDNIVPVMIVELRPLGWRKKTLEMFDFNCQVVIKRWDLLEPHLPSPG